MSENKPITEAGVTALGMFVLDVLRHDDAEQVSNILRMLNDEGCIGWRDQWPHDFTLDEVRTAIKELLEHGEVEALHEGDEGRLAPIARNDISGTLDFDSAWYRLTPSGRAVWQRWQPPK